METDVPISREIGNFYRRHMILESLRVPYCAGDGPAGPPGIVLHNKKLSVRGSFKHSF